MKYTTIECKSNGMLPFYCLSIELFWKCLNKEYKAGEKLKKIESYEIIFIC